MHVPDDEHCVHPGDISWYRYHEVDEEVGDPRDEVLRARLPYKNPDINVRALPHPRAECSGCPLCCDLDNPGDVERAIELADAFDDEVRGSTRDYDFVNAVRDGYRNA